MLLAGSPTCCLSPGTLLFSTRLASHSHHSGAATLKPVPPPSPSPRALPPLYKMSTRLGSGPMCGQTFIIFDFPYVRTKYIGICPYMANKRRRVVLNKFLLFFIPFKSRHIAHFLYIFLKSRRHKMFHQNAPPLPASGTVGIAALLLNNDAGSDADNADGTTALPPTAASASASLHATLDHPRSFAAFYKWLSCRGRAHVLDFWLAIWAFRRAWHERHPRALRIGIAFHRRFVSPRTGCCEFLPASLRAERSARLQQWGTDAMSDNFFDACEPYAWASLVREHVPFALSGCRAAAAELKRQTLDGEVDGHHQQEEGAATAAERKTMMKTEEEENGRECACCGDADRETAGEGGGRAFALQLAYKLDALARQQQVQQQQQQQQQRFTDDECCWWPTATATTTTTASDIDGTKAEGDAWCGEEANTVRTEAVEATAVMTPERMCAWMQFASAYSGLTVLSTSSCCYADGISSSSSSTAGGPYMTFNKQSIGNKQPTPQQQTTASETTTVDRQQQHPRQQQQQQQRLWHCDNNGTNNNNNNNNEDGGAGGTAAVTPPANVPTTMTITYREADGVGPPFVVRVAPQAMVTFREFRHLFAIPARNNKRFLFKEHRFDGGPMDGGHFQWTAIYDDDSPLPIFFGQIVAQCRTLSESD